MLIDIVNGAKTESTEMFVLNRTYVLIRACPKSASSLIRTVHIQVDVKLTSKFGDEKHIL